MKDIPLKEAALPQALHSYKAAQGVFPPGLTTGGCYSYDPRLPGCFLSWWQDLFLCTLYRS